jgi:hypothetical protein
MAETKKKAPAKKKEPAVPEYLRIDRREDGWWWSARSGNHKEIANSGEGYSNRGAAKRMASTLFPGIPFD